MNKLLVTIVGVLLLALVAALTVNQQVAEALEQRAKLNEPRILELQSGTAVYSLFANLDAMGAYENSFWLKVAVRLQPELLSIKAGTYEISTAMPLSLLLNNLVNGTEKQFLVTLVEGLTFSQWLSQLNRTTFLSAPMTKSDVMTWLTNNSVEGDSLEGWLLPDTYAVTQNTPVVSVIDRAHSKMKVLLNELWQNRYPDLPYTSAYQALTMASIIEKETGVPSEREHIAGVFVNRLNANMRLQTDPTVIYGIGDAFDGNLTRKHLRTPTPYNTYTIKGLPPTPIAMASEASLRAAFSPLITDDYYFVAKGDGTHYFSSTLEQHNRAVREYQLGIKE